MDNFSLLHRNRSKIRHSLLINLLRHRLSLLNKRAQKLEVMDVKRLSQSLASYLFLPISRQPRQASKSVEIRKDTHRRESIEEPSLLIRLIGERMRSSGRHNDVITLFRIDYLGLQAGRLRNVETHSAFRDQEGFIVHFVPVRGRAGSFWWYNQLDC
jgi:hypothetical protein